MSSETENDAASVPGVHPLELWREARGLSVEDAAELAGISRKTWWTVVTARALPQDATLKRIESRTGVLGTNVLAWWVASRASQPQGEAA